MFVMTAKVSKTKIAAIITAVIALVVIIVIAVSSGKKTENTQKPNADTNEARVKFLAEFGWDINVEPVQTQTVTVPAPEENEVFSRYNDLQKSQGYDLTQYAGKKAQRYVYEIVNYPGAAADCPVYATLFVFDGYVIGGDVTNTAPDGKLHGFAMPSELCEDATFHSVETEAPVETDAPTEPASEG